MKRLIGSILFPLLCLSAQGQEVVRDAPGPIDPIELESFVDGAMAALMKSHKVPGATISVVEDGEIVLAKGYGYADVDRRLAVDAETTLFRIASVSKLFAWTALMQLAERGAVDLDGDVNAYLDFAIPSSFPDPITPKHLLTHTAGFEDRFRGLFGDGIEDLAPLGEILANNIPARFASPGQEAAYSNYGAALAGYIAERVSGVPFERYVEENIYAPLGMTHSTFRQPVPVEMKSDLAIGYAYRDGGFEAQEFEFDPAIADGAMSTSAVDMARFMIAHLQAGRYGERRILREETALEMQRRVFSHDPRIAGMAYGFYEIDLNGQRGIGHGGDTFYFHTDLLLLPEHGVGLFASFNSDTGGAARDRIVPLFLDRYYPLIQATPIEPPADFASRAARFTGSYRPNRRAYETMEKAVALAFGDLSIRAVGSGGLAVDFMGEQAQIVEIEPLLFRVVSGGLALGSDFVAFREGASGEIERMYPVPTMALDKLAWYEAASFHLGLIAACLAFFSAAALGTILRHRAKRSGASSVRWRRALIVALSAANVAFAVGFGIMLALAMRTAVIPDGVSYLLLLPVVSASLLVCLVACLAWQWKRSEGSRGERIFGSLFAVVALAYLWCLDSWNLLGWHY